MKISNALYPSPNFRYDTAARDVVFERLNPDTGDVVFQVPSRETLKAEEHAPPGVAGQQPAPVAATPPAAAQPPVAAAPPAAPVKSGGRPGISILV